MEVMHVTPLAPPLSECKSSILADWTNSEQEAGLECFACEEEEAFGSSFFLAFDTDDYENYTVVIPSMEKSMDDFDPLGEDEEEAGEAEAEGKASSLSKNQPRRCVGLFQAVRQHLSPSRARRGKRAHPDRRRFGGGNGFIKKFICKKPSTKGNNSDTMSIASTAAETLDSASSSVQLLPESTREETGETAGSDAMDMDPVMLELIRVFVEYESEQAAQTHADIETVLPRPLSSSPQHLQLEVPPPHAPPREEANEENTKGAVCKLPPATDDNEQADKSPPLMQRRLMQTGVCETAHDFAFVADKVSKEVAHLYAHEDKENVDDSNGRSLHVKTGVWEVISFDKETGNPNEPFYVVTGVSMDDRVDTKKLRRAIFKNRGQQQTKRPKLRLAPTTVGEALTGYKSGTMAPICHSTSMRLFLEESLLPNDETGQQDCQVVCGSGMFGKCLSIPADKFVRIAGHNPEGVETVSLIQKRKQPKSLAK